MSGCGKWVRLVPERLRTAMTASTAVAVLLLSSHRCTARVVDGTCFPGENSMIRSHDGRYSLRWAPRPTDDGSHRLLLVELERELLVFDREACATWSPDDAFLAITDYAGSNVAEADVYDVEKGFSKRNVADGLPSALSRQLGRSLHGYVEVAGWRNGKMLVHVWGDVAAEDASLQQFDVHLVCTVTSAALSCDSESESHAERDR
jgi:hypothetical protein